MGLAFASEKKSVPGDVRHVQMNDNSKPTPVAVALGQTTMFTLPEGELVMSILGANAEDWRIDVPGEKDKNPTRYFAVKPKTAGASTVIHVISNTGDEHSFYLTEVGSTGAQYTPEIRIDGGSATGAISDPLSAVKWVPVGDVERYKREADLAKLDQQATEIKAKADIATAETQFRTEYPAKLNFGYVWDRRVGERFHVEQIWDDGRFTYIKAHPQEPPVFYELKDGKPSLVNFSFANGLYVVPKMLEKGKCGYLAVGKDKMNIDRED